MTDNSQKLTGTHLCWIMLTGMISTVCLDMTAIIVLHIDGTVLLSTIGVLGGFMAVAFGIHRVGV